MAAERKSPARIVFSPILFALALALLACLVCPSAEAAAPAQPPDLFQAARELTRKYEDQLDELAAWCEKEGLAAEAKKTRQWLRQDDANKVYVAVLPREIGPPELPAGTPEKVVKWDARFWQLRRQQANALEALARRAVRADRASLAFSLALAAIRENPDHEGIRRLLGYQKYQGGWYTLYEIGKLKSKQVWHEKYGWLPRDQVRRYQEGMRWNNGAWVTAKEDARLRQEIVNGWDVETEHYLIRTNHSLEAGVALGNKLERLYRVWKQLFVRYFASEAEVIELFDGRARRRPAPPKLQVVFFRDRDDYNQNLKSAFPNIEISIGIYVKNTRRANFFAGKDYDERTLYHEATHQLFQESRPVFPDVGGQANFWIVEGIAMYMESLREEDGFYVLGGFDDLRMKAARFRLLNDNFYVPLSEFTAYGVQKLQTDKRIATLYSQAAGLTHFLVHFDNGRYRDALVAYLQLVYSGRDNPQTLAQLTGTSLGDLDKQYRKFMERGPAPKE